MVAIVLLVFRENCDSNQLLMMKKTINNNSKMIFYKINISKYSRAYFEGIHSIYAMPPKYD